MPRTEIELPHRIEAAALHDEVDRAHTRADQRATFVGGEGIEVRIGGVAGFAGAVEREFSGDGFTEDDGAGGQKEPSGAEKESTKEPAKPTAEPAKSAAPKEPA